MSEVYVYEKTGAAAWSLFGGVAQIAQWVQIISEIEFEICW